MRSWLFRLAIALCLLALLQAPYGPDLAYAQSRVSRYVVTFEIVPDDAGELRDVRVTLEVTYDVRGESKSDGFKFVGSTRIKDVSVTDGQGQPLKFAVKHMDEERLEWYFPAVTDGQQTVVAHFTIPGAMQGTMQGNRFRADWVKNWRLDVSGVTYRFIFPQGYAYDKLTVSPSNYRERVIDGKPAIEIGMDRLSTTPFSIAFWPGLVDNKAPATSSQAREASPRRGSPEITGAEALWLLVFLALAGMCVALPYWWTVRADDSLRYPLPAPTDLDELEIAALRGGRNAILRTAMFDLWNRGMLDVTQSSIQCIASDQAPGGPIQKEVCEAARTPQRPASLLRDARLLARVAPYMDSIRARLQDLHLLQSPDVLRTKGNAFFLGLVGLLGTFVGAVVFGQISEDDLISMLGTFLGPVWMLLGILCLWWVLRPGQPLPSRLGKRTLRSIEQHYGMLKGVASPDQLAPDLNPALILAVFGMGALTGLYQPFSQAFAASVGGGGGSGGGCGGGCGGGGGGGGGGCGGCGGE